MRSRGRRRALAVASCGIFVVSIGCEKPTSRDVAASVNGRAVMFAALDRAMATQFPNASGKVTGDQTTQLRLEALRALIDDEILMQRAEKDGLLASDAEVDARFNEIKAPYTQEDFQKHLQQLRMGIPDLKAQIRRQLSVEKLFAKEIGSHITISDAEVTAFYTANRANFNLAENKIRLAQIMVTPGPDPNTSNRQGEDFGALAQSYSEDQWAANGGDIGFVPESTLDRANPELRKLVLGMTPGQVSPVIHTSEGYRLIRLISREMAGQRQLADPRVQEEIRQELFQGKQQMLRSAFYEVARSEAKIVNYYAKSVLESRDKK